MKQKNDNVFLNLLINIIVPVVLLTRYSKPEYLGPVYGLVIAVSIPLLYGLYDFIVNKKRNSIAIIGMVSIAITGGIGLLKLPGEYIAIKEALIPFIIGIIVLVSVKTKFPLFNKIIYRDELFLTAKIDGLVKEHGKEKEFKQLMFRSNIYISLSFFFSAIMNYILAKIIVVSETGTVEFNNEIGRMTLISYPIIAIPSMIILILVFYNFLNQLSKLTGLKKDDIMAIK